jgi:hypothetical protein
MLLGREKAEVTPMEIVHSNVAVTYGNAEKAKFIRSSHPMFSFATHPEVISFLARKFPLRIYSQSTLTIL